MGISVTSRDVFIPSPGEGIAAHGAAYYTAREGTRMMSIHSHQSRSDTCDVAYVRFSEDDGRTWGDADEWPTMFEAEGGTGRRHPRGGYVDPPTGRYITVWTEGVLPTDRPLEGMRQWTLHYAVSEDGGHTTTVNEQIIHEGEEYDAVHHMPGITVGRNCMMIGDLGQRPLTRSDGTILMPVQSSPVGPDGDYANPGAGLTYTDCLLLMGRWRPDGTLAWTASDRIVGDPDRTTRGLIEPTIAELSDGSLLMVMRGSNDARPELPGYRWVATSPDGGSTWTWPKPWTYDDEERFHSPSSCSQLIPVSDGRLFWMGNICAENPKGNGPRYPLVLGEVDLDTGLLVRDSVAVVDDRAEDESPYLTLSNFYACEAAGGGLRLYLTRLFAKDFRTGNGIDWTADCLVYRIDVDGAASAVP